MDCINAGFGGGGYNAGFPSCACGFGGLNSLNTNGFVFNTNGLDMNNSAFVAGDRTNPYSCPCPPRPGFLNQPHHLPGYLGHCPTMRDRVGGTFGRLSRDILEDPCAVAAPTPLLAPYCQNQGKCNYQIIQPGSAAEDRFAIKGSLAPRCCMTDIYRCDEPMNESYKGHVPGFHCCTYGPGHCRAVLCTRIFLHDPDYGKMFKFRDLEGWEVNQPCKPGDPGYKDRKGKKDKKQKEEPAGEDE